MKSVQKICLLAASLVMAASFPSTAQTNKVRAAESALVDAASLYDKGDVKNAAKLLGDILKVCPQNDAAHEYMGLCKYALGDAEYAQMHLERAVELDGNNYWYRYRLAQFNMFTGNFEASEELYSKLIEDFPKKDELYFDMIDLYARHQKYDTALEVLSNIETVLGKNESTARMRASLLNSMGDQKGAMDSLEQFNEEYSSPWVLTVLGDYNMSVYNDSTAIRYYTEALEMEEGYPPAMLGIAEAYRMSRNYPEFFNVMNRFINNKEAGSSAKCDYLQAIVKSNDMKLLKNNRSRLDSLYDRCVAVHPGDTLPLLTAGMYYYATERRDKAKEYFASNAGINSGSITAAGAYLQILSYCEDWPALTEKALEYSGKFPDELVFLEFASIGKYNTKDYQGVIDIAQRMLKAAPADSAVIVSANTTLGDIYNLLGDARKSFKAYDKALKTAPEHVPALNNYAYYLSMENRKLKKAEAMSYITVQKEPDNPTYLDTYAWILFLEGKAAEAKPYFKHAMLYGGKDSAVILDHYAEVLYALGEYDLAFAYWSQAVKKNTDGEIPELEQKIAEKKAGIKK